MFGQYLHEGSTAAFSKYCRETVGMKQAGGTDTVHDLCSALEARWNTLELAGTDIDLLKKNPPPVEGGHSARWGTFVNAKMGDLTLSDLPGVGDIYRSKLKKEGYDTPAQLMGRYLLDGSTAFDRFIREDVGIKAVGANDNPYELLSAFDAKWNALSLQGSQ